MRFMILRKSDAKTEAGVLPNQPLIEAMGKYMAEMGNAGILRAAEGLRESSKGARVKFSGGSPTVIDGPFGDARDLVGGFCLIEVGSKQEAIDWVKRWPALDGDGEVEIEIRQVFEAADFGEAFSCDQREAEERLRRQIAARN